MATEGSIGLVVAPEEFAVKTKTDQEQF